MRDAPQARFNAADDDVGIGKGFAAALTVDGDGAVGAFVRCGVRRIGVVGAQFAVGGVAVDHRVHIAGGDAKIQIRFAEAFEIFRRTPVRLADDADTKALCFEESPDQRPAETRMIDVGVAGDEDDVAGIPAARFHVGSSGRQEG